MGNFVALCAIRGSMTNDEKMLQIMKTNDGKILEFRAPIKVKDLLINYPNYYVGIFRDASQPLPLDYKLKIGKLYYLLPCFSSTFEPIDEGSIWAITRLGENNGAKRIKVVITREQLEHLMSNQMTIDDVLLGIKMKPSFPCLKNLESIPEEKELVY